MTLNPTSLLISPPNIPDPRFHNSVLFLLSDNESGSLALCLNKPLDHTLSDLSGQHESKLNFPIYWGGPMSPDTIWMLHDSGWSLENTLEINDDVSLTSDIEMLEALSEGYCPDQFRLFAGFASWYPGQLEAELKGREPWSSKHSWLVAENPGIEWLLECPEDELWSRAAMLSAQQAVDNWL
jgi:putative transcriptional regulator